MCDIIKEYKEKVARYNKLPILISDHARERINERNLNINSLILDIKDNKNLINVEKQGVNKYNATYQTKGKPKYCYSLEFMDSRVEVISGWRPLTKLQKKVEKYAKEIKF